MMKEYLDEVEGLKVEFNEDVIVMMQVGSFYEIYEWDNVGHARMASSILGIRLTMKNTKNTNENPWMCGFPLYTLGKFITKLNDEGYTVAVFDQKPENVKERYRKGVYSPAIRLDTEDNPDNDKKLFSVYIESYKSATEKIRPTRFIFSITFCDMDTGKICMKEYDTDDWRIGLQTLLVTFQPTEVIYRIKGDMDLEKDRTYHKVDGPLNNLGILYDAYEFENTKDIVVELGLERYPNLVQSLIDMLEYIQKHDPCMMTKLKKPEWSSVSTHLDTNRDIFLELNIMDICNRRRSYVERKKQKTLFDIINHTNTPMGYRKLSDVLRSPIVDKEQIQKRLAKITMYTHHVDQHSLVKDVMMTIPDMDWLLLKWARGNASIKKVAELVTGVKKLQLFLDEVSFDHGIDTSNIRSFLNDVEKLWDLEKMMEETTDFLLHPSGAIMKNKAGLDGHHAELTTLENTINYANEPYFRLEKKDNLYYFQTTKKRWGSVSKSDLFKDFRANITASTCRVYTDHMHTLSQRINTLENNITVLVDKQFSEESQGLLNTYQSCLDDFSNQIADMDYQFTCAYFFKTHGYCCPIVMEHERSGIEMVGLRHAIIEDIDRDRIFVPHDIRLGMDNKLGMLVYGINSSGKSTFLKSVALAVWLAQCGFFVPAVSCTISPFYTLMSKIGMYDNLYLGHSTFIAEMNELHHIFRKAAPNRSLVLCDELTAGTEMLSAVGIVASTICRFRSTGISHIITTHLHALAKLPEVNTDEINLCHFEVKTEKSSSVLINDIKIRYDRQLKEGPGPQTYGIEIADDMGLPKEFIAKAHEIRKKISYDTKTKKSRYNKKLWMTECFRCRGKQNLHTHHITPQAMFTEGSLENKDGLYNLIVVCEECHHSIHGV